MSFKNIFSSVKLRDLLCKQMSNRGACGRPDQSEMDAEIPVNQNKRLGAVAQTVYIGDAGD